MERKSEQGFFFDAALHAIAAEESETAVHLLSQASNHDQLVGRWREFIATVDRLDQSSLNRFPQIRVGMACAQPIQFNFYESNQQLEILKRSEEKNSTSINDNLPIVEALSQTNPTLYSKEGKMA